MAMDGVEARQPRAGQGTLLAFGVAIFTSAFLLFGIQPMFTKMVLPQLGGSPAVWSIAMVFFQALLLAGYLYAHLSTRYLSTRVAAIVHLALLAVTVFALPIAVTTALGKPPAEGQATWLIGVFLLSVGLPFFAVSGNGPLLQAWFSRSGHKQAHDPYFLYGASNLGSFAALILYPVVIEPLMPVKLQSQAWSAGFVALIGFIALAAFLLRPQAEAAVANTRSGVTTPAPEFRTILIWIALSFIPSGLLVAVTAHISTDVAAAPFLWVMPLALFLLTFVLLFRDKPLMPMGIITRLTPILGVGLVLFTYFGTHMFVAVLAVHVGFFFFATLVCHHRLYALRPDAGHLTAFYLWMSFGGVLGGLFAGLIAPQIFTRVLEYPILVVAAVLALPGVTGTPWRQAMKQAGPVLLAGGVGLLILYTQFALEGREPTATFNIGFLAATCLTMFLFRWPVLMAAALPMLFITLDGMQRLQGGRTYERSFFGVHKIETMENGQFRVLAHGTTIHGAMRIVNPDGTAIMGRPKPLTYYHPEAGIADTLRAAQAREGVRKVAVVGLGAGAHACNGKPGDQWTYFEIDPLVVKIAKDPKQFSFLSTCTPDARIVLGDARLTLADEPAGGLDYLLIDAFSSDAIPMHLMTREALALYLSRLGPKGVLAMHISNRHLELESVVASLARDAGVHARLRYHVNSGKGLDEPVTSIVVAIGKTPEALETLEPKAEWRPLTDYGNAPWTDDFSNILGALWRNYAK